MPRTAPQTGTSFIADLQPYLGAISASGGLAVSILVLALLRPGVQVNPLKRAFGQEAQDGGSRRASATRRALQCIAVVLALIFLLSALLNLGAQIQLGFAELSFQSPSSSIAAFEVVIALVLLGAAASSNLYLYGGAYLFAVVGISAGLLSEEDQGLARTLHKAMVPFVVVGWPLMVLEARAVYRARRQGGMVASGREIVTALQFFVGSLVTLGVAAFVRGGTYPVGTALGAVHLGIGLTGLLGGYFFVRREPWSRGFLIGINSVTIVYSAFADSLVQVYAFLPPGISDSLIGTIIAIAVSAVVICLLTHNKVPDEFLPASPRP